MYKRRRSRKISARTLFIALMGVSLLAMWLPSAWTRPLGNVTQLLAPAEDALYGLSATTSRTLDSLSETPPTPDELEAYRTRNTEMANRIVSLSARVEELEQVNRELTGLRNVGFPQEGRLVPARVVRRDAVAWRDAVLLDRGSSSDSKPDDWVISRQYVNVGSEAGALPGMAVLAGESLLGRIVDVAPYTSSVCLLSDSTQSMAVRIGRIESGRMWTFLPEFLLKGVGRGRMVVEDVDQKYLGPDGICVGDLVVSPPGDARLPVSLAIGRVVEIEPHRKSPLLLSRLRVEPVVDTDHLRHVYIVDTAPRS